MQTTTWTQTFLRPAKRVGGVGKEVVRTFVAPTMADAVAWVKAQAESTGWVPLGKPQSVRKSNG